MSPDSTPSTSPRQLGSYVIDSELGRGGMGVVYRARDLRLDRWVAIKMLPPDLSGDADLLARFEREARILASLHHPGIAGIHAIEDSDSGRFFSLEYIEGPTLAERLARGRLSVGDAVEIARQLATAIEAAHEKGVIHRDLKPGNIKLARVLEHDPDLTLIPAETPAAVVELLERCLVKDTRHRLRDIGDARVMLEQVLATRSASGRFPSAAVRGQARSARSRSRITITGLAAVAGIALGVFAVTRWLRAPEVLRAVAIPMPAGYAIRSSQVTPDGKMVVVSAVPRSGSDAESAAPRIFVRPIGAREFRVLPQSLGQQGSLLSTDGRSVFLTMPIPGTSQRRLVRVPIDGSAPPTPIADWGDSWNSMTALPNGDVLVMDGTTRFVRIPGAGGAPSPPREIQVQGDEMKVSQVELQPSHLPSGEPLVNVLAYDARGWHYNVGVLDPTTGHVTIVAEDGGNGWYWSHSDVLLFARGRSIFAARFDRARHRVRTAPVAVWTGLRTNVARPGFFRVLDDGTLYHAPGGTEEGRSLAVLEASGAIVPRPDERRTFDDVPTVAPDGHRFACTIANGRGIDELWTGDVSRPGLTRLGTDPDADCTQPAWSPDGTQIAYKRQAQDAKDGIWLMDLATGNSRRFLEPESTAVLYRPQTWLRDGSALIATRQTQGKLSLVRVPVTHEELPGGEARPVHASRGNESSPRISPDGRTLAYTSDETGRPEAYLAALAADGTLGAPVQVSTNGAGGCQWAADGRSVFAADAQNRIFEYPATGGTGSPIARYDLRQLNIASISPLPGRRFLVTLRSDDEGDIAYYSLIEGWMSEVERILRSSR